MRHIFPCLCLLLASSIGVGSAAQAQDAWPKPKDGWWKTVATGETATFEMTAAGMQMTMIYSVDKVAGSTLTYSTRTVQGGQSFPMETKTIDVRSEAVAGAVQPPGAKVKKIGKSRFDTAGRSFEVIEYEVQVDGRTMRAWHAADLPPIFNGGNVRFLVEGAQGMELKLVTYKKGGKG